MWLVKYFLNESHRGSTIITSKTSEVAAPYFCYGDLGIGLIASFAPMVWDYFGSFFASAVLILCQS